MARRTAGRRSVTGLWLALAGVVVVVGVVVLTVYLTGRPTSATGPVAPPVTASRSAASTSATPTTSNGGSTPTSAAPSTSSSPSASTTTTSLSPTDAPSTKQPVPIKKKSTITEGLSARITGLEAVKGTAQGPGEVAGPSIRASLRLTNDTGKRVDLSNTVVNLYYGVDKRPASVLSGPGVRALPTRVASGDTASARFVFNVPKDARDKILITVDYSVTNPIVAFEGKGPS